MDGYVMNKYVDDVVKWSLDLKKLMSTRNENDTSFLNVNNKLDELLREAQTYQADEKNVTSEHVANLSEKVEELYKDTLEVFSKEERTKNDILKKVPIGGHVLPQLPYPYDGLEPYISEEIMRLHHDVHHKGYVDGLNKAEKEMEQARKTGNYKLLKHWEREAAFHGSGHYLHSIFWFNMSPYGSQPSSILSKQLDLDFGSFETFKKHFSEAAKQVEGVGWAILVWSPRSHRLEILQTEKHQLFTQWDTIPLLVLDVWEHAYYLQYKTNKAEYIKNWWNIVNWKNVQDRFVEAQKLKWQPL